MPLVPVTPPNPDAYGRVLRRYDRDARLPIRFAGYDVNLTSRPVEAHGRVAPTLFFPKGKEAAAHRATRLGWKDETESFRAHLRGEPAPGAKPTPPVGQTPSPGEVATKPAAAPIGEMNAAPETRAPGMAPMPGIRPVKRRPSGA